MKRYRFIVEVDCETADQAQLVMNERLGDDGDDAGFSYVIEDWKLID